MNNFTKYGLKFKTMFWSIVAIIIIISLLIGSSHLIIYNDDNKYESCDITEIKYDDENKYIKLDLSCSFGNVIDENVTNPYKFLRNPPETVNCKKSIYKTGSSITCDI